MSEFLWFLAGSLSCFFLFKAINVHPVKMYMNLAHIHFAALVVDIVEAFKEGPLKDKLITKVDMMIELQQKVGIPKKLYSRVPYTNYKEAHRFINEVTLRIEKEKEKEKWTG